MSSRSLPVSATRAADYADTRHNLGWAVVDEFARRQGLSWQKAPRFDAEVARWDYAPGRTRWLVKPLTFMNESGAALQSFRELPPGARDGDPRRPRRPRDRTRSRQGLDHRQRRRPQRRGPASSNTSATASSAIASGWPEGTAQMDLKDFVLGNSLPLNSPSSLKQLDHYLQGLTLLLESDVSPGHEHPQS